MSLKMTLSGQPDLFSRHVQNYLAQKGLKLFLIKWNLNKENWQDQKKYTSCFTIKFHNNSKLLINLYIICTYMQKVKNKGQLTLLFPS